jgi:hypothetical protein
MIRATVGGPLKPGVGLSGEVPTSQTQSASKLDCPHAMGTIAGAPRLHQVKGVGPITSLAYVLTLESEESRCGALSRISTEAGRLRGALGSPAMLSWRRGRSWYTARSPQPARETKPARAITEGFTYRRRNQ